MIKMKVLLTAVTTKFTLEFFPLLMKKKKQENAQ